MKVSLFITCLVDMFQSNVGKATVELLERLGCEVDFPEGQICCGQPASVVRRLAAADLSFGKIHFTSEPLKQFNRRFSDI